MKNKNIIYISIFLFLVLLTGCETGHAHNYLIEWEFGEEVIAIFTCDCGLHPTQKMLASTEEEIIIEADCLNEGKKNVTATVMFNNILYEKTKLMTIPKMGHNIVSHESKAATCTEKGWEAYEECTRCDYTTYEEIAALNHDLESHESKSATCTEKGWEAYEECTRCDYTTYKEIAAKGHNILSTLIEPGFSTQGYTVDSCANCAYSYNHSYKSSILKLELSDNFYIVKGVNYSNINSIVIPEKYNNLPVSIIDSYAFYDCDSLESIEIPDSVTSIGDSAFYDCDSLTSIVIPNSLTSIGDSVFSYCGSLTSIVIPNSVTSIGNSAFYFCSRLTSIEIPDSVTSIGNSAFSCCNSLTSIVIPNSVTSIGHYAFSYCNSLTIHCESTSKPSGWDSFWNYPNRPVYFGVNENNFVEIDNLLYILDLENNTAIISRYTGIEEIVEILSTITHNNIEYNVTSIGEDAFYYCDSLTSIVIPNSVASIGNSAFEDCISLTIYCESTSKPSGWDYYWNSSNRPVYFGVNENNFVEIDNLQYILDLENNTAIISRYTGIEEIPEILSTITHNNIEYNVTSIGDSAFSCCSSLTNIVIPDSVTSIGDSAFRVCSSLVSIEIPDSVTSIGNSAFYLCSRLTIYCESTSNPYGWHEGWNPGNRPVVWGYEK